MSVNGPPTVTVDCADAGGVHSASAIATAHRIDRAGAARRIGLLRRVMQGSCNAITAEIQFKSAPQKFDSYRRRTMREFLIVQISVAEFLSLASMFLRSLSH